MALHQSPLRQKTLRESYVCFACTLGLLAAAAIALKWMMTLL
jgi:hypothetical protein